MHSNILVQTHKEIPISQFPKSHNNVVSPKNILQSPVLFYFNGGATKWDFSSSCFSCHNSVLEVNRFRARAASSAPLGGEYAEKLWGAGEQQKKQRIASIDQEEIEDATLIADPDSFFCEFNGVQLHHKICEPELSSSDAFQGSSSQSVDGTKRFNFPFILLHGFGASVFSWDRVMKPLARASGSKVLAFDRPAFGLTSRGNVNKHLSGTPDIKPLNPYSMMFSTLATLYFIDFLAAEKAIFVGHSAGALVAVDAYFEAPERVAALILVAPAILAPFSIQNSPKQSQAGGGSQIQENSPVNAVLNPFIRFYRNISSFTRYIAELIARMAKGMADMINHLYKQALSAVLRSPLCLMVIRMIIDKFGTAGVRSAWYDSKQVSDHILQGYTKPLRVKGWDTALAEYIVAMLTDSASKLKPPLAKRLSDISCPVLIITGDTDRLVPSWNAEKLSRAIPGSHFELIKNCGHLPQEEKAEEFLSIVDKFLQKVFGAAEEPHLQVVT